jgi:hypothetical protein
MHMQLPARRGWWSCLLKIHRLINLDHHHYPRGKCSVEQIAHACIRSPAGGAHRARRPVSSARRRRRPFRRSGRTYARLVLFVYLDRRNARLVLVALLSSKSIQLFAFHGPFERHKQTTKGDDRLPIPMSI